MNISHSNPQSSIIDPTKVNFTELTGHERVGVVNRNTNERVSVHPCFLSTPLHNDVFLSPEQLPLKQSPMLKNLKLWLEGHPHFNVDPKWGSLAIEWVRRILEICSRDKVIPSRDLFVCSSGCTEARYVSQDTDRKFIRT